MRKRDQGWIWATVSLTLALFQPASAKTYITHDGQKVSLPDGENIIDNPAISPDGRSVAYIRAVGPPSDKDDPSSSEVVLTELKTGNVKVLLRSGAWSVESPGPVIRLTFAVDGRHLFVERTFPGTSASVHSIDLADGNERLLSWGNDIAVLRNGPWRGDLLMGVHTCYGSHSGCDYPVHVVTSAGRSVYVIPGTAGADSASRVRAWLKAHRWRAW